MAIKVEDLGKKYRINTKLSGDLKTTFSNLFSINKHQKKENFWALKNVSFQLDEGKALGIIGKNGAGKSTLLKILSRITKPSTGSFEIRGKVSSLLEVGTGFHPELTGRENIFLNGTILGMSRKEVKSKFNDIVEFSGIDNFIDTPIKHYSSGMKVRLAFSVASHLEPEVLIIDEVLAVGDVDFQKKCLGKMEDIKESGRTVLFVSHNLNAVKNLCSESILIENGNIKMRGETKSVIQYYLNKNNSFTKPFWENINKNDRTDVELLEASIHNLKKECKTLYSNTDTILIRLKFQINNWKKSYRIFADIENKDGTLVFRTGHNDQKEIIFNKKDSILIVAIPEKILNQGEYYISVNLGDQNSRVWILKYSRIIRFEIEMKDLNPYLLRKNFPGIIAPILSWELI